VSVKPTYPFIDRWNRQICSNRHKGHKVMVF